MTKIILFSGFVEVGRKYIAMWSPFTKKYRYLYAVDTLPRYLLVVYKAMMNMSMTWMSILYICRVESCEVASMVQYCSPQRKFYSLSEERDRVRAEFCALLDSLFAIRKPNKIL